MPIKKQKMVQGVLIEASKPTKKKEQKPYSELWDDVCEKTKAIRNIKNLTQSLEFKKVWEESTGEEQDEAIKNIKAFDKTGLARWMRLHESIEYGEKSWSALMHYAKERGIKNYSRLCRVELIQALERSDSGK